MSNVKCQMSNVNTQCQKYHNPKFYFDSMINSKTVKKSRWGATYYMWHVGLCVPVGWSSRGKGGRCHALVPPRMASSLALLVSTSCHRSRIREGRRGGGLYRLRRTSGRWSPHYLGSGRLSRQEKKIEGEENLLRVREWEREEEVVGNGGVRWNRWEWGCKEWLDVV